VKRYPFPSACRLRSRWEFDLVFRTGQRIQGRLVRFVYVCAPDGISRYGVVAGKRMGNAPCRSRGKRLCREALRRLVPWIKEGYWIVVTVRKYGLEEKASNVYHEMGSLLASRGFMKENWPNYAWNQVDHPRASEDCSSPDQNV